jgi:hypothetical protein
MIGFRKAGVTEEIFKIILHVMHHESRIGLPLVLPMEIFVNLREK